MTNIIMLVRDRLRLTLQSIESLYANTPIKDFTICIVDDDSTDFRVKKYLRSLSKSNLSLLEVQNSGHVLAQLKNIGVAWSEQRFGRGGFLYLSDGDVFFTPGWMEALTDCAQASEREGFLLWGGQIHPFHRQILPDRGGVYSSGSVLSLDGLRNCNWTEHSILDGPSWLMRWDTWDRYGPLDRTCAPGVCQSEEYPFCERLKAGGGRIGVIHPHVVIHTGLTNSAGQDAPGRKERELMIPNGVISE